MDSILCAQPAAGNIQESAPVNSADDTDVLPGYRSRLLTVMRRWYARLSAVKIGREVSRGDYTEFGSINEFPASARILGTFAGVFSPVALSMFSALLFLRVGFVIGNAGLYETILQLLIAYGIIFFTVSSVCAIATNGEVKGGGAYFMISRTLGPEFGGSIGTLFFFANIVSSALYTVGFAEGLMNNFGSSGYFAGKGHGTLPSGPWWNFTYASALNFANLVICLVGAEVFAKTTVVVFITVTVCVISSVYSFFSQYPLQVLIPDSNRLVQNSTYHVAASYTGLKLETLKTNLYTDYGPDYTSNALVGTFATVFGVLFSGVTGIMAGANMSGELKNPARSIPRGTVSAVIFTMVVYVMIVILSAATCDRFLLKNDYLYLMPINVWPPFIVIGTLLATFSASLSTLIGSSRVMEALARDNIYGKYLNIVIQGTYKSNPIVAVLISWALVQLMLLIGSLNMIAQVNSILFLLAYVALNVACLGLELASAPNFRPSFKYFTWHTAAIGLLGSTIMMFVINPFYASSSIGLCLFIILMLHLFSPARSADWGSISQALIFHQVRKYLLLLDSRKDHVKFWRPQMLLMISNPRASCPLIDFVNDLKKSGLFVLGHVKVNPDFLNLDEDPVSNEHSDWLSLIDVLKVKAFVEITVASKVREGLLHLIRISGMGAMKPNTIIFGFYDDERPDNFLARFAPANITGEEKFPLRRLNEPKLLTVDEYVRMIKDVLVAKKNACLCRHFHLLDKSLMLKNKKFIDVYPINFFHPNMNDAFDTTSLFMLQLSCILTMVANWKNLRVRIFLNHRSNSENADEVAFDNLKKFKTLLESLRIFAIVHEINNWPTNIPFAFDSDSNVLSDDIESYFRDVNKIMRDESEKTAIVFAYLPPLFPGLERNSNLSEKYLQCLTAITNNLPPTVFVHGSSAVTSTTL